MITNWREVSASVFETTLLNDFWNLKLKDFVIELKNPVINHHGGYGGIFLGSSLNLDLEIFEELSVEFPGLSELKKIKNLMQNSNLGDPENIDKAYNSVLTDVVIGRDFPLFMLTAYSATSGSHLYPLGNNKSDKKFMESVFSFNTPNNGISSSSSSNRSVLYVKKKNKRYTGYLYLSNYFEDNPETYLSYRIWDKKSFINFAKGLKSADFGIDKKIAGFMLESDEVMSEGSKYLLLDE